MFTHLNQSFDNLSENARLAIAFLIIIPIIVLGSSSNPDLQFAGMLYALGILIPRYVYIYRNVLKSPQDK